MRRYGGFGTSHIDKVYGYSSDDINLCTEDEQIDYMSRYPSRYGMINNLTEKVKLAIVNADGELLMIFDDPSEEIKLAAVKRNGKAIIWITNPSDEIQITAVKNRSLVIKEISYPCEEAQLIAVRNNGNYLYDLFNNQNIDVPKNVVIEAILEVCTNRLNDDIYHLLQLARRYHHYYIELDSIRQYYFPWTMNDK